MSSEPTTSHCQMVLRDFAAAWEQNQTPSLEDYFGRCDPVTLTEVALDLVVIACEQRRKRGESPTFAEYLQRYPILAQALSKAVGLTDPIPVATPVAAPQTVVEHGEGAGKMIGEYRIVKELGRGGMGVVYAAIQPHTHRWVAIKTILSGDAATPIEMKRFRDEIKTLAKLSHPGLIPIYDAGESHGQPYFVMAYVPGESLRHRLEAGRLAPREAATMMAQIADALACAHKAGFVHRDLKPGNILLNLDDLPIVLDFGLARARNRQTHVTQTGAVMGTPAYMSPEQALGNTKDVGVESDIYALGAILYEMLTGRPPFIGTTAYDLLLRVVEDEPVPLRDLNPNIPEDMQRICLRCLRKSARERYRSAEEFRRDLQRFLRGVALPRHTREGDQSLQKENILLPPQQSTWRDWMPTWIPMWGGVWLALGILTALIIGWPKERPLRTSSPNGPGSYVLPVTAAARPSTGGAAEKQSPNVRSPGTTVGAATDAESQSANRNRHGALVVEPMLKDPAESRSAKRIWPPDAPRPATAPFDAAAAKVHQSAWAAYLKIPAEYTNSIGMKFVLIPPGEFVAGSPKHELDDALNDLEQRYAHRKPTHGYVYERDKEMLQYEARHQVKLTQPFYLSVFEVTQADFEAVMGRNPSAFSSTGSKKDVVHEIDTTRHPVEMVSWVDAVEFCAKLSESEHLLPWYALIRRGSTLDVTPIRGRGYRLPTDAEWEFCCRGGTTTRFWAGDTDAGLAQTAWIKRNASGRTHSVGELQPNSFGLHDVHGNVEEWVEDCRSSEFLDRVLVDPAIDPCNVCPSHSDRLIRGGSYYQVPTSESQSARHKSGFRNAVQPFLGFRVCLSIEGVNQTKP